MMMKMTEHNYPNSKVTPEILQQVLCVIFYFTFVFFFPIISSQKISVKFPTSPYRGCPARTVAGGTRVISQNIIFNDNFRGLY